MTRDETATDLTHRFRDDGFVALPGFLNDAEVENLQIEVARYIDHLLPGMPREEVFYEDKTQASSLKQIQRMFEYDDFFRDLMIGSRFEQLAATLLDHPVRGVNLQYFNKPAGIGLPTPPHQDGYYFMLEPNEAVTMWLALEDVDEENGCVRYVRGSHRQGLRPHGRTQTLGFSQGMLDFGTDDDVDNEIAFPATAGDLLVHHALTVHRADGNSSPVRSRRALGFIYYSTAAVESSEKQLRQNALVKEMRRRGKA